MLYDKKLPSLKDKIWEKADKAEKAKKKVVEPRKGKTKEKSK